MASRRVEAKQLEPHRPDLVEVTADSTSVMCPMHPSFLRIVELISPNCGPRPCRVVQVLPPAIRTGLCSHIAQITVVGSGEDSARERRLRSARSPTADDRLQCRERDNRIWWGRKPS